LRTDANSGDHRRLTRALPALAFALCALALALGPTASARAASGPDAVVLVSGFTTTTPFTTPAQQCRGTAPRGTTWSYEGAQLAAAGYRVFTAPVRDGGGPVKPSPPEFSGCPTQLPASMTINSVGDIYANASALAAFIAHLHSAFGVHTVRFVDHSYGGLWTRGAIRLAEPTFPDVQVQSVTTLGTPHLGSFLADIAEAVDPSLCGSDLTCELIVDALIAYRDVTLEPGLSQLTAASLAQWNPGQGTSLDNVPLTAIAGDAVSFPGISNTYVSPNDVLVGLASAQAVGLDSAGVIPRLSCFSPFPDVHSNTFLPLFPGHHSLLGDPGVVTDVEQTLAGNAPTSTCPNPPGQSALQTGNPGTARGMTVPLREHIAVRGRKLPPPRPEDAIFVVKGSRVTCGGHVLPSVPFFGSDRLGVIVAPNCRTGLEVSSAAARVLDLRRTQDFVRLRIQGRRIFIHVHHRGGGQLRVRLEDRQGLRAIPLDGAGSLRVSGKPRTVTLRLSFGRPGASAEDVSVSLRI
jgi:hypothetical protein